MYCQLQIWPVVFFSICLLTHYLDNKLQPVIYSQAWISNIFVHEPPHQHYLKEEPCPNVGGDEWEAWIESLEIKEVSVWWGVGGIGTNLSLQVLRNSVEAQEVSLKLFRGSVPGVPHGCTKKTS